MLNTAAVIVAHPDDETLWVGGTILMCPEVEWTIITLCRQSDPDRAPKFFKALQHLHAKGAMGDLDDGPEQVPLSQLEIERTLLSLLPHRTFDLTITHGPYGEYTRHLRHEETSKAVAVLWENKHIKSRQVWMFAYEDGGKNYLPRPIKGAHRKTTLPENIWNEKYRIITDIYGFSPDSFEALTTPRQEAFWCFDTPEEVTRRFINGGVKQ